MQYILCKCNTFHKARRYYTDLRQRVKEQHFDPRQSSCHFMGTLLVLLYIKIKIGLLAKRITLLSPMLVVGLRTSTTIQTQGKAKSLNTDLLDR